MASKLPQTIVDLICEMVVVTSPTQSFPLNDLKNSRLVSKIFARGATQVLFRHLPLEMTASSGEESKSASILAELNKWGSSSVLREVTLRSYHADTAPSLRSGTALKELETQLVKSANLRTLTLQGGSAAPECYDTWMKILQNKNLPRLSTLDILDDEFVRRLSSRVSVFNCAGVKNIPLYRNLEQITSVELATPSRETNSTYDYHFGHPSHGPDDDFSPLFGTMTNLRDLRLSGLDLRRVKINKVNSSAVFGGNIDSLRLTCLITTVEKLLAVIQPFQKTLKSLTIEHSRLLGNWQRILAKLIDYPALIDLHFSDLRDAGHGRYFLTPYGTVDLHYGSSCHTFTRDHEFVMTSRLIDTIEGNREAAGLPPLFEQEIQGQGTRTEEA